MDEIAQCFLCLFWSHRPSKGVERTWVIGEALVDKVEHFTGEHVWFKTRASVWPFGATLAEAAPVFLIVVPVAASRLAVFH